MTTQEYKRRLTAILSADVEGYSRLMQEDEEATVRTITAYRTAMTHLIEQYRGRVVDSPGDNILAEFTSVVDAVNCAVEIQRELAERNAELPDNRKMKFRIGVNLGDVLEEGKRIYGDGVNIAARMEGLAEGGGISISGTVYDAIQNKIGLEYEYLGEHQVKNIDKPVRAYRVLSFPGAAAHRVVKAKRAAGRTWRNAMVGAALVVLAGAALALWQFYWRAPKIEPASKEKMAFPLPDKPSIAVLPFVNMSGDPGQEFLVDGITENIITALSGVSKLFVIARNSTFTYKGKPVKVQQVAEDLGVRYVLEGSITRSGDRIRVTAQLIDALKGHHLWAERYDREMKDIFGLQDDLAMRILRGVGLKIMSGEDAFVGGYPKSLDVFLKMLKAQEHLRVFNIDDNNRARIISEECMALEPDFWGSHALVGSVHTMDYFLGSTRDPVKSLLTAIQYLEKAVALSDRAKGRVYPTLGYLYSMKKDYDKAIELGEKAIALVPSGAEAHAWLAMSLNYAGRVQEAIPLFEKAIRLNPFPPSFYYMNLGNSYRLLGRFEEAVAMYKKTIALSPNNIIAYANLAGTCGLMGKEEEAKAAAAEILRLNPKWSIEYYAKTSLFKDKDRVIEGLRKAGLPEKPPLPLPDKPSIAVLPFTNMSDDKNQEYFSDGMTEDLITDLSKISGLFVIARNSTFVYKGKAVNVQQIGRELGVKYVLEGSVRRAGDQLRINAQLVDATTGQHLWAERYDGSMKDVFSLQDKINGKIVAALAVKLTADEKSLVYKKETTNLAAYEEFLKGREHYHKFTIEDLAKAMGCFKKAIELDPNYRRAKAMLALLYNSIASRGAGMCNALNLNYVEARLRARQYLINEMGEPTSITYLLSGHMNLTLRQWDEAISHYEKALALDPNDALIRFGMSWGLNMSGRPAEGMEQAKSGMRLDPLNPARYLAQIGIAHFCKGEWQSAVTASEQALKLNPEDGVWWVVVASAYGHLGRNEEAKAAYQAYREQQGGIHLWLYFWPFKDRQVEEAFVEGLMKAGWSGGGMASLHVSSQDQITGHDLKAFYYPSTLRGSVGGSDWSLEHAKDGTVTFRGAGLPEGADKGRSWLEGDKICTQFQKLNAGLPFFRTTFRNPRGTPQGNDEYLGFSDLYALAFSKVK